MSKFVKYPDIEQLGKEENSGIFSNPDDEIVIEEKVDGINGSFWLEDGIIHVASRNKDLVEQNDVSMFKDQRKHLLDLLQAHIDKINPNYIYYIEWMQKHTIFYGEKVPPIIGLDIKPIEGAFGKASMFIGRRAKEAEFKKLGIACVSLKAMVKAKEINRDSFDEMTKTSAYYDGAAEGIVFKNYGRTNIYGRQIFGKVVRAGFKEVNRAVFGGLKKDNSDAVKFTEAFATEARIRKAVLNLTDQGIKLDRSLMKFVPFAVIRDIFKEESDSILSDFKQLEIGIIKSMVSKSCLKVIDAMLLENAPKPLVLDMEGNKKNE
jgi:hypothetical protein